eukprot:CAMPEP_0170596710 /NCGR_PEP_ID=MMETSP0224-20130122/15284_1 /TAXON_ID=285029 /ORGANISM="Togula jolla, Strain CCCM 725" /LENGTH=59 /DNA_ID=CAMNT_0010921063 /DNA_START=33 /DNA_END=209 /DNA_ORIENTATION=-
MTHRRPLSTSNGSAFSSSRYSAETLLNCAVEATLAADICIAIVYVDGKEKGTKAMSRLQ